MTITVEFHPQAWQGEHAIPVDPLGPTTWEVELTAVEGMSSNTTKSDELRLHPNAPKWVQQWHGPFWIEIHEVTKSITLAEA